ncbi:glycosyltransferase involved in cell wall biosynthesis [Pontibacter ummariensis]|uniref:Glycosyltransferase involved in cell wall bisynthesis n=1 Tax=Pontibacter ummariensis TaxID=1610492 RepID=A0A239AYI4_9BACT|nr:glycosyltransferase family 4 protein [Pontibacter ummariensis]PRY16171.1 glycosyltransferase involved in cell wall biosynthesis [Pontibacter ummariensis]SNS00421.1 Glycosyltransferase involved in cell wall bisynthesis [Pontibacter ummariensis]
MRVLHLVSEKTWRGGEQQVAYLIEELLQQGAACYVACRRNTPFEAYCQKRQVPYISLPFANEFDLVTAQQIKRYCQKQHIDLVHAHSGHAHAISVWAHLLGNKRPIILSRRVDFPVKDNALSQFKYNYKGIRRIICVSDKIKEVVSQSLKHPELCVTIHSGIDMNRFADSHRSQKLHREFNLPPQQKLIGNISAIAPHKDYFTFVDTAAVLLQQRTDLTFFVVGDGPLREQVEAYVQGKHLQGKVIFTGFRNDVPQLMPELDVFLITSETEGLGTTILDAFSCRTPVVATAAGGIPEIVQHEQTGMLAPIKDSGSLAHFVQQVLQRPALREHVVEQAYQKVLEFTKEQTALKTLAVYREVLGSH